MRPVRSAAAALAAALLAPAVVVSALAGVVLVPSPAAADDAAVPGALASTAVNTARFSIPVPGGVVPEAITGILRMPELVHAGVVTFRVNGRIARTVDPTLYKKVRIPVTAGDVIADGTMSLTIASQGPAVQNVCRPAAGEATFRNIKLEYRGNETAPTTLANFFPTSSARIDVFIPPDSNDDLIEAGLAAVAALSSRYPEGTPIQLGSTTEAPTSGVASQRAVILAEGRAGEVTTDIAVSPGNEIPTLTISATGEDLAAAARALAQTDGADTLQLADDPDAEGLNGQLGQRAPQLERTLAEVGAGEVVLSGYGETSQLIEIPQDAFSTPISAITVHLEGAHSAVADADRARLDVRMNGDLVYSEVLDETGDLAMDFTVPAGRLRSVNDLELVLSAVTADGLPCAAPGSPPVEIDIDTDSSTLTATAGKADTRGFQLFPQVLQSSLPVAIRADGDQRFPAAQEAARIVASLQDAASFPLDVQLVPADAFIADDRSGLIVGATAEDAASLGAPLKLSSIRLLDQPDSSFEVTSQEPYAVLEAIDADDRQVVMLGGWSPGNQAAPRALLTKAVDFLQATGWSNLEGDLLLTDASAPPFTVDSRTLAQEETPEAEKEERSYAKWFVAGVALLLLLLAFQVAISIRRDRKVAQVDDEGDDPTAGQPAYLEDLEFREQHLPPDPSAPPVTQAGPAKKTAPGKKATPPTPPAKKTPGQPTAKKTPVKRSPNKKRR